MWPRKYGWLNFAILECSLSIWIVNKPVFAAPELREKCAAKSEVFTSPPQMTSHKLFGGNFQHEYLPHYAIFWVKSYKRNQWYLPNILAYISDTFNDFFKGGLVPFMGSMLPCIGRMELLAWMQRADFSEHVQRFRPRKFLTFRCPKYEIWPDGLSTHPIISQHYNQ